jgi:hypothetical protein
VQGSHRRRLGRRRAGVLDRAVRAYLGRADAPGRHRQLGQLAGLEGVAVQPGAGDRGVPDQQELGVGVEVGVDLAGQVEGDLALGVGEHVPQQQFLAAVALVQEQ